MDNPLPSPKLESLAAEFLWNAENALADSSPFYAKLARRVADDSEILALAAHAQPHQPAMNMLFAAVHFLLLRGLDDPLANFFADLTRKANTEDDSYPIFRAFCEKHADEIISLVSTRRVQTNEVARCALFLPAFTWIARQLGAKPFALIEVGSSAGLNLNWDRYAYDYGNGAVYGNAESRVVLKCELRGAQPPLSNELPRVFSRTGIDLNPNSVFDDDAMLWLRALVWPSQARTVSVRDTRRCGLATEQLERAERLQNAITLAREFPPRVLAGDAIELAPRVIQEIPQATPNATPIILFHSFVLNQVADELRAKYYDLLEANRAGRILFDVAIEPSAWPAPLVVTSFENGTCKQQTLATCDHHGRWLEWSNN